MIYLINCSSLTDQQRESVQKALDTDPRITDWRRALSGSWFVETKLTDLNELRKIVHVGADKVQVLAVPVYKGMYAGWADKSVWEWLNKKEKPAPPKDAEIAGNDHALGNPPEVTGIKPLADYRGIDAVAARLNGIVTTMAFHTAAARAGLSLQQGFQNMLILGPPGTGKTSLAKTAAEILRDSLPGKKDKRKIHMLQAADLIDRHVGKSMNNTKAALDAAAGGILIFDEIDALLKISHYGPEVLNALNAHITHAPNKPVIIATLYGQNEQALRAANPGLMSRFPHVLRLESYKNDTLAVIFNARAAASGMNVEPAAVPVLSALLAAQQRAMGPSFGNAREIDNIFDAVVGHIAERFAALPDELKGASTDEDLARLRAAIGTVTAADIPMRDPDTGALVRRPGTLPGNDNPPPGKPGGGLRLIPSGGAGPAPGGS